MNTPDPSILLQESEVYRHCESARVELGDAGAPLRPVGQARAEAAIRFGLRSARAGFNIYAAGPPSTGKRWLAEKLAREYAATQTPAFDVLYAPVPTQPQRLQIIKAAPGSAAGLADNMDRFLAQLSQASNRDHCLELVDDGMAQLASRYRDQGTDPEGVHAYLDQLASSLRRQVQLVAENLWLSTEAGHFSSLIHPLWQPYRLHVMSGGGSTPGVPVMAVDNPDMESLFGYMQSTPEGVRVIPGVLHRANHGIVLIDVQRLFQQPELWDRLKAVLASGQLVMRNVMPHAAIAVQADPFPLSVKVILYGERNYYYRFHEADPEFTELFKVVADFSGSMIWNDQAEKDYAHVIAHLARSHSLPTLTADAVARLIEYGSRWVEDQQRLTLQFGEIADVMVEASYCCAGSRITAADIEAALAAREHRSARPCENLLEEMVRGELLIDTDGGYVGQVNGLTVIEQGDALCGHPSRITARVHVGKGEMVDIEREVDLGGPIHSKGVLILHGYIAGRYIPDHALSLSASLVFEQTYGGVEGDSASSAELFALLSALAGLPVNQAIAVTGSVNQMGDMQSIGAVNEKIEGFFRLCQARGLNGEHGVIIPAANVQHLMLDKTVRDAMTAGQFHVYAVDNVDQGMTLLTGMAAGERDVNGRFPPDTINGRVEARLLAMGDHGDDKADDKSDDKDNKQVAAEHQPEQQQSDTTAPEAGNERVGQG